MGITRIPTIVPYNKYTFNDTFEDRPDPVSQDPDAFISQDLNGEPWIAHRREFDIEGRTGSVPHLVRLLFSLHDRHEYLRERHRYTGVLINHQETGRLEEGQNGHEFYVVETDNNIRFVASPVDDLSSLSGNRIVRIRRLPHQNRLYHKDEQYRSQHTPLLLARDSEHENELVPADTSDIHADPLTGQLRVIYVDKYRNALFGREGGVSEEQELLRERIGKTIGVKAGTNKTEEALVTQSLRHGPEGSVIIYPNGDNIDLAWKWGKGWSREERRTYSAFEKLGRPSENSTTVVFEW